MHKEEVIHLCCRGKSSSNSNQSQWPPVSLSAAENGSKKITLRNSDGEVFESQTIKHMIENDCADNVIPFDMEYYFKLASADSDEDLKAFDKVDQAKLFDLNLAVEGKCTSASPVRDHPVTQGLRRGRMKKAELIDICCRGKSLSNNNQSQWPPVWKSIEECPQYFVIVGYLEACREKSTDPKTLLLYKQVEETRGYDVTVDMYGDGLNPFSPDDPTFMIEFYELWCQAAVEFINKQAEMHGELYEYFEFVKCVHVYTRTYLMTFKVKKLKPEIHFKTVQACILVESTFLVDVEEWRFKPE